MNVFRNPFFLPYLYPTLTWRKHTDSKVLYLTFDDGPVSGPTEFVLDTLAKAKAPSTFFCIGDNIQKNPVVFKKIISGGHVIGNHTFNHLSGWRTATDEYIDNVKLCEDQIKKEAISASSEDRSGRSSSSANEAGVIAQVTDGVSPFISHPLPLTNLFRPPYGRITRNQIKSLSQYEIVMWDVLTHDYAQSLSQNSCLKGSIEAARPGSIVVFHDSHKAERNMTYVLPRFIEHFANLGYTFKSLR